MKIFSSSLEPLGVRWKTRDSEYTVRIFSRQKITPNIEKIFPMGGKKIIATNSL